MTVSAIWKQPETCDVDYLVALLQLALAITVLENKPSHLYLGAAQYH